MSDEWKKVTKHDKMRVMRRGRGKMPSPQSSLSISSLDDALVDKLACLSLLEACRQELESSVSHMIRDMPVKSIDKLVCYGVGNFSSSSKFFSASLYQLAFALCLRDAFTIDQCYYLDPCMTNLEKEILCQYQVQILKNRQGRQSFDSKSNVLFFMPHCPKQLYEHVLWAHYDKLAHTVILGNSLINYVDALEPRSEEAACPCLDAVHPYVRELAMQWNVPVTAAQATGNFEGAFNDTYWTTFHVGESRLPPRPVQLTERSSEHHAELL